MNREGAVGAPPALIPALTLKSPRNKYTTAPFTHTKESHTHITYTLQPATHQALIMEPFFGKWKMLTIAGEKEIQEAVGKSFKQYL